MCPRCQTLHLVRSRARASCLKARDREPPDGDDGLPTSPRSRQRPGAGQPGPRPGSGAMAGGRGTPALRTGSVGKAVKRGPGREGTPPAAAAAGAPAQPRHAKRGVGDRLDALSAGSSLSPAATSLAQAPSTAEAHRAPAMEAAPASATGPSPLGVRAVGTRPVPLPVDLQPTPTAQPQALRPLSLAGVGSLAECWAALRDANPGTDLEPTPHLVFLDAEEDWLVLDDNVPWDLVTETAQKLMLVSTL
uniref:Auxin-responsive protein n=1 Tax=Auxenochlorella protothecoides TaxID=3075 RepID=A0A1D2A6H0_AUXPR